MNMFVRAARSSIARLGKQSSARGIVPQAELSLKCKSPRSGMMQFMEFRLQFRPACGTPPIS